MRTQVDQQLKHNDCGISAVKTIFNLYGLYIARADIEESIQLTESGASLEEIKKFFDGRHFETAFTLLDLNSLKFSPGELEKAIPCILPVKGRQGQHYVVIKSIRKNKLEILDPAAGQTYRWTFSELMNRAYIATANYDYISNKQLLQHIIYQELSAYGIDAAKTENHDIAGIFNKLTYFFYLRENFGFSNPVAEKNFLLDLLFNQELGALPRQFKTLKLNEAKLRITTPVVLTVKKPGNIILPEEKVIAAKPVNAYRKLISEMKAYHKLWAIYIASALFAALIGQLTIFSNQILIDNILPDYSLNLLILFAIGLGIFKLFDLILSLYKTFISVHLANIFDNFFLSSFVQKLNSFSIRYIQSFSRGDLTERIKDSLSLKTFFIRFFTNILIDAFVALYSLMILFIINWKISMIVVAVLGVFILWFYMVTPYIRENEKRRFLQKSDLFSSLFENIDGLQVIKSFRLEAMFMQRLAPKIKSILAIQKKVRYVNLINSGVINFIIIIAGILIISFLSQNASAKGISVGQIITFLALSRQVFSAVSSILDENLDLQENNIILQRYFDFGKTDSKNEAPPVHPKIRSYALDRIEFRNVAFHYVPHRPVFSDLNIVINKGDKIQLEGSNGTGKSTFCKVLSLLYIPDSGNIFINNEKHHYYSTASLRKKILLVSNEDILFNDTLGYNLSFDYTRNPSEILALAKEIGLHDFIAGNAEGLDYIINEQGRNLSTGQRKKILMMRAFLSEADLVILDETLSGIDKESREKIENYINRQTGRSFIIISHEPLYYLKFSKTLIMQNGTINQLQHAFV